jgi:hypothetical protein
MCCGKATRRGGLGSDVSVEQREEMFDLFSAADSFLRQPSGWLVILLVVIVVWLIRVVIDMRSDIQLVKQASAHNLTPTFLAQFSNNAQRRQLDRIRSAARRAAKSTAADGGNPAALLRFEQEVKAEIDALESTFGTQQKQQGGDSDDYSDIASSSSQDEENAGLGNDHEHEQDDDAADFNGAPGVDDYDHESGFDHESGRDAALSEAAPGSTEDKPRFKTARLRTVTTDSEVSYE